MARDRRDDRTLDLLDWQPPEVAPRIDQAQVRAETLRGRISRAVAVVLRDSTLPRETIVKRMSQFLDEPVSLQVLNAYASQARNEHTISAIRLVALAHATGDIRALQVLIDPLDYTIIPNRYLPAIDAEIANERAEELSRKVDELRQQARQSRQAWKGGARR